MRTVGKICMYNLLILYTNNHPPDVTVTGLKFATNSGIKSEIVCSYFITGGIYLVFTNTTV